MPKRSDLSQESLISPYNVETVREKRDAPGNASSQGHVSTGRGLETMDLSKESTVDNVAQVAASHSSQKKKSKSSQVSVHKAQSVAVPAQEPSTKKNRRKKRGAKKKAGTKQVALCQLQQDQRKQDDGGDNISENPEEDPPARAHEETSSIRDASSEALMRCPSASGEPMPKRRRLNEQWQKDAGVRAFPRDSMASLSAVNRDSPDEPDAILMHLEESMYECRKLLTMLHENVRAIRALEDDGPTEVFTEWDFKVCDRVLTFLQVPHAR